MEELEKKLRQMEKERENCIKRKRRKKSLRRNGRMKFEKGGKKVFGEKERKCSVER